MHQHAWLIFVFLVEIGFHHVGQAGLKLTASSDPPALTSQSVGIIGVSHICPSPHLALIVVLICISLTISDIEHFFCNLKAPTRILCKSCFTEPGALSASVG